MAYFGEYTAQDFLLTCRARQFGRPPPDSKAPEVFSKIVAPFDVYRLLERGMLLYIRARVAAKWKITRDRFGCQSLLTSE